MLYLRVILSAEEWTWGTKHWIARQIKSAFCCILGMLCQAGVSFCWPCRWHVQQRFWALREGWGIPFHMICGFLQPFREAPKPFPGHAYESYCARQVLATGLTKINRKPGEKRPAAVHRPFITILEQKAAKDSTWEVGTWWFTSQMVCIFFPVRDNFG